MLIDLSLSGDQKANNTKTKRCFALVPRNFRCLSPGLVVAVIVAKQALKGFAGFSVDSSSKFNFLEDTESFFGTGFVLLLFDNVCGT